MLVTSTEILNNTGVTYAYIHKVFKPAKHTSTGYCLFDTDRMREQVKAHYEEVLRSQRTPPHNKIRAKISADKVIQYLDSIGAK